MLQISFNGERLKEARLFNKKSITQIAEFLNVSKQMVSKYEKGRATPSEESLEILEKELKFPRDFFFGNDNFSLSSTGNLVYIENYAGHGTNKAAVEAMVRYAANELGEFGIRVNAVSGGPIDTDALKAFTNYEEVKAKTAEYSPLNRIGQPEDLAQSCYFLCTNDASWITGHTLIVDGGTTFR